MRQYVVHFTDGTASSIIPALNAEIAKRMALAEPQSLNKQVSRVEELK